MPKWRNWDRKSVATKKFRYPKAGEPMYVSSTSRAYGDIYYWRAIGAVLESRINNRMTLAGDGHDHPHYVDEYCRDGYSEGYIYSRTPFED